MTLTLAVLVSPQDTSRDALVGRDVGLWPPRSPPAPRRPAITPRITGSGNRRMGAASGRAPRRGFPGLGSGSLPVRPGPAVGFTSRLGLAGRDERGGADRTGAEPGGDPVHRLLRLVPSGAVLIQRQLRARAPGQ